MRVFLSNLGCKLNQAEVDSMARQFLAGGHELVGELAEADLHVVNSCTVTQAAARDSRRVARRAGRRDSGIRTVVTGCWASDEPLAAARIDGVDLVVGNRDKHRLIELVGERIASWGHEQDCAAPTRVPVSYVPLRFGPTRGLVKIEDGCNMRCAFCIIPSTRGRQQSRPVDDVVAEVDELVEAGYREIVITGVQISSYRSAGRDLSALVGEILERSEVPRLRLTSIAPWQFDDRLLALLLEPRICRHLHLSLQSGCDATLRRMRRPYSSADFARLVAEARAAVPGIAITSDVIVGFPGESEEEFAASLDFVGRLSFARSHVFKYSVRAGTEAASLGHQIAADVKKRRVAEMLVVARRGQRRFRSQHRGLSAEVLWEECVDGVWRGTTDNYIRVFSHSDSALRGRLTAADLLDLEADGMTARPLLQQARELGRSIRTSDARRPRRQQQSSGRNDTHHSFR